MNKIYSYALFIDLPNFYSNLLRSSLGEDKFIRDYFLNWLDFDLLSSELAGVVSPIWIFYSGQQLGPSTTRIRDNILNGYIQRINSLRGVTAKDVNIPGEQREPFSYTCECGRSGDAQWKSEKGIDASLTVHLFDTVDTWDIAYLLSGDADFVPAVSSLRRKGKIIVGAGFSRVSPALVRECYDYIDLSKDFFPNDIKAYALFKNNGLIHKWLTDPIESDLDDVVVSVRWKPSWPSPGEKRSSAIIQLTTNMQIEGTNRKSLLEEFTTKFSYSINPKSQGNLFIYEFTLRPLHWDAAKRRLEHITRIQDIKFNRSGSGYFIYTMGYKKDKQSNEFMVVSI